MASVSVVGQQHPGPHRLDSELLLKLSGARKKLPLPRKPSWEKMVFRRSSVAAAADCGEPRPGAAAAGPAGRGGGMPGEGCGATRSREKEKDKTEDRDPNTGIGGSLKWAGSTGNPVVNGHRRAHRHRDRDRDRDRERDPRCGEVGLSSTTSTSTTVSAPPGSSLNLERLTQGRTGVVKLARAEPHRREAWSIFPRGLVQDPRVRTERGEGHWFQNKTVSQDWCDACSRQITAQALKCQNCSYTCHLECETEVQLDCNQRDRTQEGTPPPRSQSSSAVCRHKQNETKEEEEGGTKDLSEEEVRTRIEEYNAQVSENGMKLASDGSYTGFIKVHLRLSRPVTVPAVEAADADGGTRSAGGRGKASEEERDETDCGQTEKRTSFYLPCDCVKQLHISSLTTTREVIQGLLKKFMVLDNPRKFALYRQTHRDGQDLFQKLPLCERPLLLRLIAGPDAEKLSFVLKENETGEVEWHAFSVPELQNFLVILEKEETERVRAVEQKYGIYRQKLLQALRQHDPSPVTL